MAESRQPAVVRSLGTHSHPRMAGAVLPFVDSAQVGGSLFLRPGVWLYLEQRGGGLEGGREKGEKSDMDSDPLAVFPSNWRRGFGLAVIGHPVQASRIAAISSLGVSDGDGGARRRRGASGGDAADARVDSRGARDAHGRARCRASHSGVREKVGCVTCAAPPTRMQPDCPWRCNRTVDRPTRLGPRQRGFLVAGRRSPTPSPRARPASFVVVVVVVVATALSGGLFVAAREGEPRERASLACLALAPWHSECFAVAM